MQQHAKHRQRHTCEGPSTSSELFIGQISECRAAAHEGRERLLRHRKTLLALRCLSDAQANFSNGRPASASSSDLDPEVSIQIVVEVALGVWKRFSAEASDLEVAGEPVVREVNLAGAQCPGLRDRARFLVPLVQIVGLAAWSLGIRAVLHHIVLVKPRRRATSPPLVLPDAWPCPSCMRRCLALGRLGRGRLWCRLQSRIQLRLHGRIRRRSLARGRRWQREAPQGPPRGTQAAREYSDKGHLQSLPGASRARRPDQSGEELVQLRSTPPLLLLST
mmetsp:Transcript_51297/g.147269  ORF Transcript_51297/g.147269 Transcript_51297/m.147269 type:complete len:277 (+) Transcript_51297:900-1730(+)